MTIKPNQIEVQFLDTDKTKLDGIQAGAQVNPTIASQAVAEAGVDNSQYMTAIRVKQAINVFASSAGETNLGANVGTGEGSVFAGKSGVTLQFKKLQAGTNVTISENSTEITINASGGGGAVDSVNTQTGAVVLDADDISDSSTTNKWFTGTERTKLSGIATGAQVNPSTVSQAEAEAGTATVDRLWTAQRVKQAIIALTPGATPLVVKDEGTPVDSDVAEIDFVGSGVTVSQTGTGAVQVSISGGGGGGQETQYLSFDSGRVRILATGETADLASVTADKDFTVSAVSRLILNRPTSVQFHSVAVTFTAAETAGRTEVRLEFPEPNSATQLSEAIRPIAYRLNAISNVAATGGTVSLAAGTLTLAHTGYTGGQEQRMITQF